MQLLANNYATGIKKRYVNKTDEEASDAPKTNVTQEKNVPIKHFGMKSSKTSALISGFIYRLPLDIQALLMNTNIIILALYLFQISPKFWEEICHLVIVLYKPRKKMIIAPIIPIVEEKEELYVGID